MHFVNLFHTYLFIFTIFTKHIKLLVLNFIHYVSFAFF